MVETGHPGTTPRDTALTEQYNGSSWTEVNDLNSNRRGLTGAGIYTAALAIAGYTTTWLNNVESWNGSNWTEIAEVNKAASYRVGIGTQTMP